MKKHRKKRIRIIVAVIMALAVVSAGILYLFYSGILLLNNPSREAYPVQGVDVSSYQGDINWEELTSQDIQFAFIKATEGSTFVDKKFAYNYKEANKTGIRVGAYHFFSYDSEGKTQAENFISTVDAVENMLPPVVDIEFYGDKEENTPDVDTTRQELTVLLEELEQHYGLKPIIYATKKSYDLYIADEYSEYSIWIRDIIHTPSLSDQRNWTFWQYTSRETLDGYKNGVKYIDMNVFYGTKEEFAQFGR